MDGLDEVVLCGHSSAGMVISEAAAGPHRAVRQLVYLTAAIPDSGDSLAGPAKQRDTGTETDEPSRPRRRPARPHRPRSRRPLRGIASLR
jgi:pimeloyl-ACP methyl ester carboxylesterase